MIVDLIQAGHLSVDQTGLVYLWEAVHPILVALCVADGAVYVGQVFDDDNLLEHVLVILWQQLLVLGLGIHILSRASCERVNKLEYKQDKEKRSNLLWCRLSLSLIILMTNTSWFDVLQRRTLEYEPVSNWVKRGKACGGKQCSNDSTLRCPQAMMMRCLCEGTYVNITSESNPIEKP